MTDIFLKMNEVNMSFQEKELAKFVASNEIQAFKHKLEFGKSGSATVFGFPIFNSVSNNISGDINIIDLFDII